MYFANDYLGADALVEALTQQLELQQGAKWMALIDTAFDYGSKPLRWHAETIPLYDCEEMYQFLEVSPVLLPLTSGNQEQLTKEIAVLSDHCKNRPMLSFMATSLSINEVAVALRHFLKVTTEDGQSFVLRFADTRILSALADVLRPASWHSLTHTLNAWYCINRVGALKQLPFVEDNLKVQDKLTLNAQELVNLLERGQPDAVIDVIFEQLPDLVPNTHRAEFYRHIAEVCAYAKLHKVDAFPDMVALATLACATNNKLLSNPKLKSLLALGEWESGSLISKLEEFVE